MKVCVKVLVLFLKCIVKSSHSSVFLIMCECPRIDFKIHIYVLTLKHVLKHA